MQELQFRQLLNSSKKIHVRTLVKNRVSKLDRNTELALDIDVMMVQAKKIKFKFLIIL